jgi:hypothetical protein
MRTEARDSGVGLGGRSLRSLDPWAESRVIAARIGDHARHNPAGANGHHMGTVFATLDYGAGARLDYGAGARLDYGAEAWRYVSPSERRCDKHVRPGDRAFQPSSPVNLEPQSGTWGQCSYGVGTRAPGS